MTAKALKMVHKTPVKQEVAASTLDLLKIKMPHSNEIEEVVIGGLLLDILAYKNAKQFLPKPEVFFRKHHQTVFKAVERLAKKNGKIDFITVNEEIKKVGLIGDRSQPNPELKGRKLNNFVNFAITSLELVQLSDRVASTANIEAHAGILHQLFIRRETISRTLVLAKEAANPTNNIFDLLRQTQKDFRASNPSKVIKLKTMNEAMAAGAAVAPSRWVAGNLFKESEVCILFADAGDGKSVLAFQIADAASKGEGMFRNCDVPDFQNQCEPKLTHFYDFELEEPELWSRYSQDNQGYDFSDKLKRGALDPDFLDFENADELIASEIERDIEIEEPEVVVIDNLTYIISESQDSSIATKLMKRLLAIQKRSRKPLTIIVIAHTPKRDPSVPILMKNLAGSANLANFAKSIVAISKSSQDEYKRYIKHIKCRNGKNLHGQDNVIECIIGKNGARLEYEFVGFSKESEHLMIYDNSENEEEAIELAVIWRKNNMPLREIAKRLKSEGLVKWSHSTVNRKIIQANSGIDTLFDEIDEKHKKKKSAATAKDSPKAKTPVK